VGGQQVLLSCLGSGHHLPDNPLRAFLPGLAFYSPISRGFYDTYLLGPEVNRVINDTCYLVFITLLLFGALFLILKRTLAVELRRLTSPPMAVRSAGYPVPSASARPFAGYDRRYCVLPGVCFRRLQRERLGAGFLPTSKRAGK
jgi:hypothetical protein